MCRPTYPHGVKTRRERVSKLGSRTHPWRRPSRHQSDMDASDEEDARLEELLTRRTLASLALIAVLVIGAGSAS